MCLLGCFGRNWKLFAFSIFSWIHLALCCILFELDFYHFLILIYNLYEHCVNVIFYIVFWMPSSLAICLSANVNTARFDGHGPNCPLIGWKSIQDVFKYIYKFISWLTHSFETDLCIHTKILAIDDKVDKCIDARYFT